MHISVQQCCVSEINGILHVAISFIDDSFLLRPATFQSPQADLLGRWISSGHVENILTVAVLCHVQAPVLRGPFPQAVSQRGCDPGPGPGPAASVFHRGPGV